MDTINTYSVEEIWSFLNEIPDPEIPVITIVELGVVRDVVISGNSLDIIITPTYSGCPATERFIADIKEQLTAKGITNITVKLQYSPAWTSSWLTDKAKQKLKEYGIAPPVNGTEDKGVLFSTGAKVVPCPRCNSTNTKLESQFGSTACKAFYTCKDCLEPFDYFKCI
jgi:ring-1,2-phenylacetyl-CoA epoxidase subunit PaaD